MNFSPFWRLFGEFPRKFMSCWRPYYAVHVPADVSIQYIYCCWLVSTFPGLRCGSPFSCWRCDVPIVSAAVGLPPCFCWLHCFCKHPCFWWRPYCVGGPVVAFIPAAACVPAVVSGLDIAVILNVAWVALLLLLASWLLQAFLLLLLLLAFLLFLLSMLLLYILDCRMRHISLSDYLSDNGYRTVFFMLLNYSNINYRNKSTNVSISKLIIGTKPKRFDLVRL